MKALELSNLGIPSRRSTERSADWKPLRPSLVVEVRYDHVTNNRFRHGTKLMRWRPDKAPAQCTFDQLRKPAAAEKLLTMTRGAADGWVHRHSTDWNLEAQLALQV